MNNYRLDICKFHSYGHYEIGIKYYGKLITKITTDMPSIDDYNSEEFEKDGKKLRRKRGYLTLKNEIIRGYKYGKTYFFYGCST